MKAVILDAETMGADIDFSPVEKMCSLTVYSATPPEKTAERIKDAQIVILNKVKIDKAVLEKAERLRLICVFAVGYNNIDTQYCRERGISVRNTPGYCVDSVCQHTFALLFMLSESLDYYDAFVKSGAYSDMAAANHLGKPFCEVANKRWGIIGMGAIGRKTGSVAQAFGAEVVYASVSGAVREEPFERLSMDELLKTSDIISLSTPLTTKSAGLIGERELSMMKPTAVLVNVSRGAVTDEAALARAIDNGKIAGAAIDVYSEEPPKITSPLMKIKNKERVVFSPHIAWGSVEARRRCVQMTANNIADFLKGEKGNDVCL